MMTTAVGSRRRIRADVEVKAGLLVLAEVREHAGVHVDEVGPVGVVHAGIQDDQTRRVPTTDRAEAALIASAGNKLSKDVVSGISLRAALVDRVDHEVGGLQFREWKYLRHG